MFDVSLACSSGDHSLIAAAGDGDSSLSMRWGKLISTCRTNHVDGSFGMVDIHDRRPVVLTPKIARKELDPVTPKGQPKQMVLHQGEPKGPILPV